jgi:hypothetical protein
MLCTGGGGSQDKGRSSIKKTLAVMFPDPKYIKASKVCVFYSVK